MSRHAFRSPFIHKVLLAACALALAPLAPVNAADAPARRAYSDPSEPGPLGVGVMRVEVRSRHHAQKMDALVWYPAEVGDAAPYIYEVSDEAGPVSFNAVEGAQPLEPRDLYPVIAYSHGAGGYNYQGVWLTEHLASHGYVVIAVAHPRNTETDWVPTSMVGGAFTRPKDISAALDHMESMNTSASSPLRGMLDLSRMGVTGYSYGGYTSLAVGGARFNLNPPRERCQVEGDGFACALAARAEAEGADEDGYLDLSDPRVGAIAPMAPWTFLVFRDESLSFVTLPVQVHGGELDTTCSMALNVEPVWDKVSGPRSISELWDANHTSFSANCSFDPTQGACLDPYVDPEVAHALLKTWITSHFKVFLDGDERYQPFLSADYAADLADLARWEEDLGIF